MLGVSLVICCHNSTDNLPKTIKYLNDLNVKRGIAWELIFVDNASTDSTHETVLQLLSDDLKDRTNIITEKNLGIRYARQSGIAESRYEFISFIDDDNLICTDWVNIVYDIMLKRPEIGACGGLGLPMFDMPAPSWFEQYKHCYAVGAQSELPGYIDCAVGYLWGAGLTIRKSAWDAIINSNFPFSLVGRCGSALTAGEDVEICFALRCCGWRLWYDDRLTYYHVMPAFRLTLNYLEKMYRGFGKADAVLDIYEIVLNGDFEFNYNCSGAWIKASWKVILFYLRQIKECLLNFDQQAWIKLRIYTNYSICKFFKIVESPINYNSLEKKISTFAINADHKNNNNSIKQI